MDDTHRRLAKAEKMSMPDSRSSDGKARKLHLTDDTYRRLAKAEKMSMPDSRSSDGKARKLRA